jgi:DtxR family transcriptional regulator, Mn-dependent transcriptional regulator
VADTDVRADLSLLTELLEVLLDRADRDEPLRRDELPAVLGEEAATAEVAVRHLTSQGYVDDQGDTLALTASGSDHATVVVRRHRLAERLLRDVIGLDWWKVHHEAESWESIISPDVEAHLVELLGDPGTCPHGNPIPGSSNRPSHPDAVRMTDAPIGPVYVVRITEELETEDEALQLLEGCGFLPGQHAELKRIDDTGVEVAGSVSDAFLPRRVAHHTFVAPR